MEKKTALAGSSFAFLLVIAIWQTSEGAQPDENESEPSENLSPQHVVRISGRLPKNLNIKFIADYETTANNESCWKIQKSGGEAAAGAFAKCSTSTVMEAVMKHSAYARALKHDPRNADHPDHALYAALQQRLPPQTSDDTVAHVMLQAKIGGVRNADELDKVIVQDGRAFVMGTTPGFRTAVDLSQIPPPMQETTQRSEALDQQHAMQRDQWLAQDQAQSRGMHRSL